MILINTTTAREILGLAEVYTVLGKPEKKLHTDRGGRYNLYSKARVLKIKAEREEGIFRRTTRGGSHSNITSPVSRKRHCTQCGRLTMSASRICVVCEKGFDPEDEYGVILPPKKRTRLCECGNVLYMGEQKCLDCKAKKSKSNDILDTVMAYGGMVE